MCPVAQAIHAIGPPDPVNAALQAIGNGLDRYYADTCIEIDLCAAVCAA